MKRSVLLIGLDSKGKILLHHKTPDAPTNGNLWVLMGGSIEQGEEPIDAIRREMKEELNIIVEPTFFKMYTNEEPWGVVERHIFYGHINEPVDALRRAQQEGDNLGFFTLEGMAQLLMNKNHLNIIDEFLGSQKDPAPKA